MKISEVQLHKIDVLLDVLCDSCGKSCKVDEFTIDNDIRPDHGQTARSFEYMDLETSWGYHSKGKDLTYWSAQICEECVENKLSFIKFKKGNTRFTTVATNKD